MGTPWGRDRPPLEQPQVERAVGDQFPDLRPVRAEPLASGWDHDAWRVNDTWVFRFPRRADVVPHLLRERALLPDLVAPALRPVAVPVPERLGRACEAFPYPFAGHRFLPGTPASSEGAPPARAPAVAPALGRALAALHALPTARAQEAGVPVEGDRRPGHRAACVEFADAFRDAVGPACAARWEPHLRGEAPLPPPPPEPWVLTHNDLGGDHLLLDPESGDLVAVLDWTDLALGDRAADFAGLHAWFGEPFVLDALRAYGGPPEPGFLPRVRHASACLAILWLAEAQRIGGPERDRWRRWFLDAHEPRLLPRRR